MRQNRAWSGGRRSEALPHLLSVMHILILNQAFYPDVAAVDIRADMRIFYGLFYGVTLSEGQLDRLLGGTAR